MWSANLIIECGLTITVMIWMIRTQVNEDESRLENEYDELILSTHEIFVLNVIEDISDSSFRFDILLAIHTGFLWLKVMLLLKLTRTFGPLIKIVQSMLVDIG